MKVQYVIVGFNTEAYVPVEIASVTGVFNSFDDALKNLKEYAEEDGCFDMSKLSSDGCIVADGCHRGYYIQEVFVQGEEECHE